MRKTLLALAAVIAANSATADTISISDLPTALRDCTGPACHIALSSAVDIGGMSAFSMFAGGEQSWLLRYTIGAGSADSVGAHLWMRVSDSYDLSQDLHGVTVFMDEIDTLRNRWSFVDDAAVDFLMTTDALLASSAWGEIGLDSNLQGFIRGNLLPAGPPPAATAGFSAGATLDLLYLNFTDDNGIARLQFDPGDARQLLFSQFDKGPPSPGWPPETFTREYLVEPVPLPAAWGLFAGSLALLGAMRRRGAVFPRPA